MVTIVRNVSFELFQASVQAAVQADCPHMRSFLADKDS